MRREGAWLREHGLTPTLFCGGGWYTDRAVALACAELRYTDCTPRATRPGYLADTAAWAELPGPARIELGDGARLRGRPDDARPGRPGARTGPPRATAARARLLPRHGPPEPSPTEGDRRGPHAPRPAAGPRPTSTRSRSVVRNRAAAPRVGARRARARPPSPRRRIHACRARHPRSRSSARRAGSPDGGDDIRRSRVYVLSRGALVGLVGRAVEHRGARRRRHARARARRLSRARPPLARLRRHDLLVAALGHGAAEWLPFLAPITVLVFLQAGLYAPRERRAGIGADPGGARARGADRARVRPRHRLRLHDDRADPDGGADECARDRPPPGGLRLDLARADAPRRRPPPAAPRRRGRDARPSRAPAAGRTRGDRRRGRGDVHRPSGTGGARW